MFSLPKMKIRNNDNANSNKTSLLMCASAIIMSMYLFAYIALKPYVMHYGTQPLVKIEGQFTSYRAGMFKFVDGTFHGFVLMILFACVFMLRNTFFVGWVDTHTKTFSSVEFPNRG